MKNIKMDECIHLILVNCIVISITAEIYFEITNRSIPTVQNYVFVILFYSIILKILTILFQCIHNTNILIVKSSDIKFSVNMLSYINLICFIMVIMTKYHYIYNYMQIFDAFTCFICSGISYILLLITNSYEKRKENSFDIKSMKGLDYGTSMAYSYYYGYLRIILPSTGSINKGLIEKIENIEDSHGIYISVPKLFILIPSSAYIPPNLKEASYHWMESAMNLEKEVLNRAGVKGRTYHNSVYKIYPNGQRLETPFYIVVEGASPLLTFYEVQKHAHNETNVYKKYCKVIIQKFYEKLKQLIDADPECADLCELIYYDDYDNNGSKVNVAKVILDRIFKIQNITVENTYNIFT
ncbi:transmembrane protein sting [Bombus fervidus]|uniref:transmembrane protein sting n=1 Tax=Bombus fervidus TaxID=203811 RepID=UPI003AB2D13A